MPELPTHPPSPPGAGAGLESDPVKDEIEEEVLILSRRTAAIERGEDTATGIFFLLFRISLSFLLNFTAANDKQTNLSSSLTPPKGESALSLIPGACNVDKQPVDTDTGPPAARDESWNFIAQQNVFLSE